MKVNKRAGQIRCDGALTTFERIIATDMLTTEVFAALLFTSKPSTIWRFFFRLPAYLYKLHLGWLLGHKFLLLLHRGRRSGRVRETVLEVLHYEIADGESTVLSGWGTKAEWFRNIQQTPALSIQIGFQRFNPVQRILGEDEAYSFLEKWRLRHPIEAWILSKLFRLPPNPSSEALRDFVVAHPVISFRPRPNLVPPTGSSPR